jgi:response regulator RpfG family c-di-GMP phosphodiesterase
MSSLKGLLVDDSKMKQQVIQEYIKYINSDIKIEMSCFTDPIQAIENALTEDYDIVLLDYLMPNMNGIEFLRIYRRTNKQTPVIMITSEREDHNLKIEALQAGVSDFLTYPCSSAELAARFSNLISMRLMQKEIENKNKLLEVEVLKATRQVVEREQETLSVLARLTEYKDTETELHTERVARYSRLLAQKYGFRGKQLDIIYYSAPLHDIGKIGIPDNVLLKNEKFDELECEIMKRHTIIGYKILQKAKSEFLAAGRDIALCHHEYFNGRGYPYGIKGKEIPIEARIVAVADVFDALLSERPYKKPWDFDEVVKYIISQKGLKFDPHIVDLFEKNIDEIRNTYLAMGNKKVNI